MESSKLVWFPSSKFGFGLGKIVDIGQKNVTVQPLAWPSPASVRFELDGPGATGFGPSQPLECAYKSVFPCDQLDEASLRRLAAAPAGGRGQPELADADDSCALIQLHEAALLENVRVRFQRDKIYTYVAHILIAVNPYVQIKGLHSAQAISSYQGKSLGTMPPHVFAIADKAFRDMKAFKQSQSIIISGESGAGKTESQKYVLRYLCLSNTQSGRLVKLILDANPLLEAFGNAKTIRNNNSSRFGKFIEVHYSNRFTVTGGLFFHYLLEKSRICTQSAGERNYHIFYQLCACLPRAHWKALELGPPDGFRYLAGGCTQYFCSGSASRALDEDRKSADQLRLGAIQDQLIDDVRCYEQTERALTNFGLDEDHKQQVYAIVAAVLHLGNISFCDDPDGGGCKLEPGAERPLATTARLIGLEPDMLRQALVTRIMSTARGGHKGTVYMVQLSQTQAQAARDALAKAIYSKLFDYIVSKIINRSIPSPAHSSHYIGVLDVAGFEYFQHNSFEQFLINFCNEKLQQFFNERILKEEQQIYEAEGLNLERVEFVDNEDCISLFEMRSTGLFDLLDEESKLPRPSAQHFTQALHGAHKAHFRLALPRASKLKAHREIRDDEGFLIKHFAGAVCYETQSFIEKNNDALHGSLRSLMLEAGSKLLRDLFADAGARQQQQQQQQQQQVPSAPLAAVNFGQFSNTTPAGGQQNKLNFVSVASTFRSQLGELMHKLRSTGSHFIRCIKPNSEMVAHKFEGGQILSQLHCSGMDSVLRLMQRGYPSRSSFNDLYAAYSTHLPPELKRLDSHLFCRALFKAIGLSDQDFRFGSSKVFFRPGKFAEFDQLVRTSDGDHLRELVRRVSRWLVRARWRKAQYCARSVVKLARKIHFRRDQIIRLQRNWRAAIIGRRLRFRLEAVRGARGVEASLVEFEQIASKRLRQSGERSKLEAESHLLRAEVTEFVASQAAAIREAIGETACGQPESNNNNRKSVREPPLDGTREAVGAQLERMRTKRDLLVRSLKEKLAKEERLAELERKVAVERKQREVEEISKRRDEELKRQRLELEQRRQVELRRLEAAQPALATANRYAKLVDSATDSMSGLFEDQEQRDYEIALRLASDSNGPQAQAVGQPPTDRVPLAPSENLAQLSQLPSRFDLTKWKYCDLRDTINTSCDLELLEACKREFHRRLRVYHAWRAANASRTSGATGGGQQLRVPSSLVRSATATTETSTMVGAGTRASGRPEQRFFRIPFLKSGSSASGQRGWWFAHFDGQWIARQLELHPDKEPILLVAGQHDMDMCELSLEETRLGSKRGAEILASDFEAEWTKHGGQPYKARSDR